MPQFGTSHRPQPLTLVGVGGSLRWRGLLSGAAICISSRFRALGFLIQRYERVNILFQEYVDCRGGLIIAFNSGLDTLIEEGKKIGENTPYEQRKCLWDLNDRSWELQYGTYSYGEPPPPEPLLRFEDGLEVDE